MNAIGLYRLGNWFYKKGIPIIPNIITKVTFLIFNSYIPHTATLGKGTKFAYGGIGCIIHSRVSIGLNCIIGSNVTIGGKAKYYDVPFIGDNVYISTGSKVIGNVKIGNGVIIGANVVVTKDVPDNCTVVGVPAKIIKTY